MNVNGRASREIPLIPGTLWRTVGPKPIEHSIIVVANTRNTMKEPVVVSCDSLGNIHARKASTWVQEMLPTNGTLEALGLSPMLGVLPTPIVEVLGERDRQKRLEGFSDEIDDMHGAHTLLGAAFNYCYSAAEWLGGAKLVMGDPPFASLWPMIAGGLPWPWKPKNAKRDIERAAALLLAQLEKLDRESRKGRLVDLPAANNEERPS